MSSKPTKPHARLTKAANLKTLFDSSITPDEIRAAVAAGADVNARDGREGTPLHEAGTVEQTQALIAAGADVNARDGWGQTPIHRPCSVEQARALIAAGADVTIRDRDGEAAWETCGNMEIRQLLIDNMAAKQRAAGRKPKPKRPAKATPAKPRGRA